MIFGSSHVLPDMVNEEIVKSSNLLMQESVLISYFIYGRYTYIMFSKPTFKESIHIQVLMSIPCWLVILGMKRIEFNLVFCWNPGEDEDGKIQKIYRVRSGNLRKRFMQDEPDEDEHLAC